MYDVTGYTVDGQQANTIACGADEVRHAYRSLRKSAWISVKIQDQQVEINLTRSGCRAGVTVSEIWDQSDFSVIRVGHRCQRCS